MKAFALYFCNILLIFTLLKSVKCQLSTVGAVGNDVLSSKAELLKIWDNQDKQFDMELDDDFKLYAEIDKEIQKLTELQQTTKKSIKERSIVKLSNILSGNRSSFQREQFHKQYNNLVKKLDAMSIESVLSSSIASISKEKSSDVLFGDLCFMWLASVTCQINSDTRNLEPMIKSQLMLYKSYEKQLYPNYEYLKKLSLLLNRIKKSQNYENLKENLKYAITSVTETFPDNLKYIFFKPYFCMMNEDYKEFIYTAMEARVNSYTRYIWLWHDKYSIDNTGQIQAQVIDDNSADSNELKMTLRGTLYNLYYYLMSESNRMVGGLAPWKTPFNHIWNVQLLDDDKIVLRQNGTIVCSNSRHDAERRLVNSLPDGKEFNEKRLNCQWSIGSCKRN